MVIALDNLGQFVASSNGALVAIGLAYVALGAVAFRFRRSVPGLMMGIAIGALIPLAFMLWFASTFNFPE